MTRILHLAIVSLCAIDCTLCGCGSIGSRSVAPDRFDYTEALSSSWKQQMLINMVKVRYGDTPVFLDVASVINQYSVETQVDFRWTWMDPVVSLGNSQSAGGTAKYGDRPTITYAPLMGERFARSLMKPLPPPAVLSMIEAGYPIDVIFRACVHSINGIRNRYGGSGRPRPADPDFYPVLERMRQLQLSGAVALRFMKTGETEGVVMTLRNRKDPTIEENSLFVRKALGLDPSAQELRVTYGSIAMDNKELAILTRSMLEIIVDLASYIDVPAEHVQDKRVNPTMATETVNDKPIPPLIRIHSSRQKPDDAFVAVPYRNYWYWIDEHDLPSKRLFSFLIFVFSLTETGGKDNTPIVTIPAG